MTIEIQCPGCSAILRVGEELAGQQGKCQHCGKSITVPAIPNKSSALAAATPDDIVAELSRRDRSAVLVMFDTPESGTYELSDLVNAKVRCYSTNDMDDAKTLQALGSLGRIAQSIDQNRDTEAAANVELLMEFKGDRLGVSLAEFKKKHKRKTSGIGMTLPWCSSDSPGQKQHGLLSEPWHAKCGIVHARIELPVENSSPTVAGVKTELFLYQFIDARLFRMTAFFETDSFHVIREAMIDKYGDPTSEVTSPVQFVWDNGVSAVQLVRGTIRPKRASMLHYVHHRLFKELEGRTPNLSEDL